jgi:hypothetical protein
VSKQQLTDVVPVAGRAAAAVGAGRANTRQSFQTVGPFFVFSFVNVGVAN